MFTIVPSKRFKRQFKKLLKADKDLSGHVLDIIDRLARGETLTAAHHDHQLKGKLGAFRECHVEPDWLLVYRIDDDVLLLELVATGSHSQLFR